MTIREYPAEITAAVEERDIRRDHDVVRANLAATRDDGARAAPLDVDRTRRFVNDAALRNEIRDQAFEITHRIELRLLIETDRGMHFERETAVAAHESRRKPGPSRGLGFTLDGRDLRRALRVHVRGAALEAAIDAERVDLPLDPFAGGLIRSGIAKRRFSAVPLLELVIDESVLRRDLRRAAARHAMADPRSLEERDGAARTLKHQRRRYADDSAADDRDLRTLVAFEGRRERTLGHRREPARLAGRPLRLGHRCSRREIPAEPEQALCHGPYSVA